MIGEKQRRFDESAGNRLAPPIQAAIVRLAEAYDYARDMQCDLWDFAVEIDALTAIGLSVDDLRWLVTSGYVRHGREITRRSDAARDFRPTQDLNFTKKTCFVATDAGLRLTTTVPIGSGLKRVA
ncbi:MAG: hypothetical protein ABSA16_05780 [Thermoguttaceae bacterium]|jgi:hypothetical protein